MAKEGLRNDIGTGAALLLGWLSYQTNSDVYVTDAEYPGSFKATAAAAQPCLGGHY